MKFFFFVKGYNLNKLILSLYLLFSFNCYALDYVKIEKEMTSVYDGQNIISTDRGSGIQWNDDYIVTAKHVNFIKNSVYECSEDCDLRFVKYKNTDHVPLPTWRNDRKGEELTVIGNSVTGETKIVSGKLMDLKLFVDHQTLMNNRLPKKSDNTMVKVINAAINSGQSGGPVYANDGSIVGMAIGHTVIFDEKGNEKLVSLYIPYKIIKSEWMKFKRMKSDQ